MNQIIPNHGSGRIRLFCAGVILLIAAGLRAAPVAVDQAIQIRHLLDVSPGAAPVRLAKDPRDNTLYFLKLNGEICRLTLRSGSGTSTASLEWTAADHGLQNTLGMA